MRQRDAEEGDERRLNKGLLPELGGEGGAIERVRNLSGPEQLKKGRWEDKIRRSV